MNIADKGLRLINFFIDTAVLIVVCMIAAYLTWLIHPEIMHEADVILDVLFFTIYLTYYFLYEGIAGRTIGKMVTKTIVAKADGSKPGVLNIFLRTIVRLIPFDAFTFLFGSSGLHDLLSKTKVIRYKQSN